MIYVKGGLPADATGAHRCRAVATRLPGQTGAGLIPPHYRGRPACGASRLRIRGRPVRSFVWRVCVECVLVLYAELCGVVWVRVPSVREGETGVELIL